jgi:hypothetical protein
MDLERTRRSLHAVAELLLAGPQHASTGEIALAASPGGFRTTHGREVRVDGTDVVLGDRREPIDGRTVRDMGAALGLEATDLRSVYSDGSGLGPDDVLHIEADAAAVIAETYRWGHEALTRLAPAETPVLWPEHFDLAVAVDEVNFGVVPGDGHVGEPYAYVGPWTLPPPAGDFWNASFGSTCRLSELADVDGLLAYFERGRELLAAGA